MIPTRRIGSVLVAVSAAMLAGPATAGAGWNQSWAGVSASSGGLNQDTTRPARQPDVASGGGTVYAAWEEADGASFELRVARLNGNTWEQPWTGVSAAYGGINQSTTGSAGHPSLAVIDGVPYVAWLELEAGHYDMRVARLNGATWEQPWTGVSATSGGINQNDAVDASASLAGIGGVPYVAWAEKDGTNNEVRVARLNGSTWQQPWTGVSATSGGINQDTKMGAGSPSLASVGGVPYLAWLESTGPISRNYLEVRVARLNAGGTWEQGWNGASATSGGINRAAESAGYPSLTSVGGLPYVAWTEFDGFANRDARVARLAGNDWEEPATGASSIYGRINQNNTTDATHVSLASIGGVPYLAWLEEDDANYEVRIARLDAGVWEQPWTGVSATSGGINQSTSTNATEPSLIGVGGVPWLVWAELDGTNYETRAARLEPEFTSVKVAPGDTTAILQTSLRTYGVSFPVGFDFGATLESRTVTQTTPAGRDTATITSEISGLTPSSSYRARAFATAGSAEPRVLSATAPFDTKAPGAPPPTAPTTTTPSQQTTPQTRARTTRATCRRTRARSRGRRRVRCTVIFTSAATRRLTLRLTRRGKSYATSRPRSRARIVTSTLTSKRTTSAGNYVLVVTAVRANGTKSSFRRAVTIA